jgi:hypothetical protein
LGFLRLIGISHGQDSIDRVSKSAGRLLSARHWNCRQSTALDRRIGFQDTPEVGVQGIDSRRVGNAWLISW